MIDLRDYGYEATTAIGDDVLIPARITEIHKGLYKAICVHGEIAAVLKGSFIHEAADDRSLYPAVGDFVLLKYNPIGNSSIAEVLPRKSKFSRSDFSGHAAGYVKTIREQVVAANFDYIFIISSLNQDFNINRIARYLTAARQSGAEPVVLLSKADLCSDYSEQVAAVAKIAKDIAIIALSCVTGMGLNKLEAYLKPAKTLVFLGMSGVGKSSLLNTLAGEELMSVSSIREEDGRGRHTTTHRQLLMLPGGALVIDTPGMRELGLWRADTGLSLAFAEIEELFAQCRFPDCSHKKEPGCAVLAALADGSLSHEKWQGYLAQKREAAFVESKSKQLKEKQKSLAQSAQKRKKK